MSPPLVFISYSHRDEKWKDHLVSHLGFLKSQGLLDLWDDRRIETGEIWHDEISTAMGNASVAVLLVSAHFLSSKFVLEQEVPRLLDRWANGGLRVLPIIVKPCAWDLVPWLQRLQVRPQDARPLSTFGPAAIDSQLAAIASEIAALVSQSGDKLSQSRDQSPFKTNLSKGPRRVSISRMPTTGQFLVGRADKLAALDQAWEDADTKVLSIVAWGGIGKSALMNHWLGRLATENYRGADRVYAWSFYLQGTQDQLVSADEFVAAALRWFGDKDPSRGSEWDRGVRLAELVSATPTLMILDGLEPLQYPPGPQEGRLKDKSLSALLRELAGNNPGLCVISSRLAIADLQSFTGRTVKQINLESLSPASGAELLRRHDVWGDPAELQCASEEYGGHGLALTLLGTYLRDVFGGDITKRQGISQLKQDERKGGNARRVMEAYERWLSDDPMLSVLHMVGLFDRPARAGEIAVLRNPPIAGLSESLREVDGRGWLNILADLRRVRLLSEAHPHEYETLDAHPLVREYFGARLRETNLTAWTDANDRLYEFFRDNSPELPETMEEMESLMRAIVFGCRAGRYRDALHHVYLSRVMRGRERYATSVLGAHGAVLATLAHFFEGDWRQPVRSSPKPEQKIDLADQLRLLTHVGPALLATRGWSSAEVVEAYDKAREICREIGPTPKLFNVVRGLWSYHSVAGKLTQARELALDLMRIAEVDGSKDNSLEANMALGHTDFWLGDFEAATSRLKAAIELYHFEACHDSHTAKFGEDPGAISWCYQALATGVLGFAEEGEIVVRQSLRLGGMLRQNFSKGFALCGAAWFYTQQLDGERTMQHAAALLELAREYSYAVWAALARALNGWALTLTGRIDEGIAEMSEGRSAWHATGGGVFGVLFAALLADACLRGARLNEGLSWVGVATAAAGPEGYYLPEVYRLKAELLHALGSDESRVQSSFTEAISIARAQGARLFELRAAVSQCRLSAKTERRQEAVARLRETFDWFTEGFETVDLLNAQATLDEFSN